MFKKLPLFFAATIFCLSSANAFEINSNNIKQDRKISEDQVFNGFGCSGKNISPQISWRQPPIGTKSFALTVYDPDAPTGSGWWHWLVLNIPATYHELPLDFGKENKFSLQDGMVQIRNDFGIYNFGGPCPPKGRGHRYFVTVYALKTEKIDITDNATAALAGFMINQNVIAKTQVVGVYNR
jgi:Raf kinase inhibitor-like YbhB/YbcL family protein